jgi:hypothetical protein
MIGTSCWYSQSSHTTLQNTVLLGSVLFLLNYGFDLTLPSCFSVFKDQHPDVDFTKGKCPGVNEFFKRIQQAIADARKNIEIAQQQQKHYADLKRRPDENFEVGVKVLLCTKNLYFKKGSTIKAPSKVYWTIEYN